MIQKIILCFNWFFIIWFLPQFFEISIKTISVIEFQLNSFVHQTILLNQHVLRLILFDGYYIIKIDDYIFPSFIFYFHYLLSIQSLSQYDIYSFWITIVNQHWFILQTYVLRILHLLFVFLNQLIWLLELFL